MIRRAVWLPALFLLLCGKATFCTATVRSAPEHPIIEVRECNQFLNFDMAVQNTSKLTLRISQIELGVYDPALNWCCESRSIPTPLPPVLP